MYFIKVFLLICGLIIMFCVGFIHLGEYFAFKFEGSKFDKWWKRNIIDNIPKDLED